MKKVAPVITIGLFAACISLPAFAQDKIDNELTQASQIIQEMTGPQSTAGIPNDVLRSSKCIAVIPRLLKAGCGFGGEHGNGVATCKLENGHWSPPAPFSMSGGSFGLQIGGEEEGYIMLAMTDEGMQAYVWPLQSGRGHQCRRRTSGPRCFRFSRMAWSRSTQLLAR